MPDHQAPSGNRVWGPTTEADPETPTETTEPEAEAEALPDTKDTIR